MLLLAFTLLRGGTWAMTQPYFWAPDEDYHFLYAEYLTTQRALPSPDRPMYTREYTRVREATHHDSYAAGPRPDFSGDPKASADELARRSRAGPDREPVAVDRGVNVVHAPLYYVGAAAVNAALGDASPFLRIAAMRWLSSALGVLAVFCAWLLAAQVFRREWLQLTVAALVALQPMIAFLSGIVSNDIAVTAGFTAAVAMLLFIQRERPVAAQGLWVGGAVALALLVKSTALALLPLAAIAYAGQAVAWPQCRRVVARSGALALGVVAVGAGWWYVLSAVAQGSATGATSDVIPLEAVSAASPGAVVDLVSEWVRLTYRTYWWHYLWPEAPRESLAFWLPSGLAVVTVVGVAVVLVRGRRALASPVRPLPRQVLIMVAAVLALWVPLLATDVLRALDGEGFLLVAGRLLLPAYACVAALAIVAARELSAPRLLPWVCGGLVAGAGAFCWSVYWTTYVHRYFGDGPVQEVFRRISFDRPGIVTPTTYSIVLVASLVCLGAAFAVALTGARRTRWIVRPDYDLPPVTDRFAAGSRPILVVGASGLLGAYLHRSFGEAGAVVGTGFQHVEEGLVRLDLRDQGSVQDLLEEHRPATIVCAAAVSNVERCEADPLGSRSINVDGTLALARGAAGMGATFVFLSSEYVFDGLDGPYDEDAPTRPLNEYGRQKQEVERLLPGITGDDFVIARVSCLYGHERIGKNFVYQLWAALSEGREFRPPSDQIGTPTAVSDAADVIRDLLLGGHRGTFHVAGPQPMLRSEFARLAARELELDPALVRPRPTGELGLVAPRPMDAGLSTGRVRAACRALCAPREGIAQMLAERPIGAPLLYAPR